MADAGADQETGRGDPNGKPRLETSERGVNRGEPKPEIGDAHFILERARGPADRGGRLLSKEDMADEGPQPLNAEREEEEIAQEPIDNEAAQHGKPLAPDRDTGEGQC